MKKIIVACVGVSIVCVTSAFAATNPVQKLGRGIVNVVTAPVEIPKEIRAHWIKGSEKTYHIIVWIFCGTVKGVVMTGARIGSGSWDIATAPINIPQDYAPLLKPEYVFDYWPKRQEGVIYKNLGDK